MVKARVIYAVLKTFPTDLNASSIPLVVVIESRATMRDTVSTALEMVKPEVARIDSTLMMTTIAFLSHRLKVPMLLFSPLLLRRYRW